LGTSTSAEAKEYFGDLDRHIIDFEYSGLSDTEAIDLAFNKKKADARKVPRHF
jgi:DNA topoisomerase-2